MNTTIHKVQTLTNNTPMGYSSVKLTIILKTLGTLAATGFLVITFFPWERLIQIPSCGKAKSYSLYDRNDQHITDLHTQCQKNNKTTPLIMREIVLSMSHPDHIHKSKLRSWDLHQKFKETFDFHIKDLPHSTIQTWLWGQKKSSLTLDQKVDYIINYGDYGRGIYGIERATHDYFKKPIQELSVTQQIFLIARLVDQTWSDPHLNPNADKKLQAEIWDFAQHKNLLLNQDYTRLESTNHYPNFNTYAPLTDSILPWVENYEDLKTTFDLAIQDQLEKYQTQHTHLLSLDLESGSVEALASEDLNQIFSHFNPEKLSLPLIYLSAFENHLHPATIVEKDIPEVIRPTLIPWNIKQKNAFSLPPESITTLRTNYYDQDIATIARIIDMIGSKPLESFMDKLALEKALNQQSYYSLVFGEVSLFELARAFGIIARGGEYTPFYWSQNKSLRGWLDQREQNRLKSHAHGKVLDPKSIFWLLHIIENQNPSAPISIPIVSESLENDQKIAIGFTHKRLLAIISSDQTETALREQIQDILTSLEPTFANYVNAMPEDLELTQVCLKDKCFQDYVPTRGDFVQNFKVGINASKGYEPNKDTRLVQDQSVFQRLEQGLPLVEWKKGVTFRSHEEVHWFMDGEALGLGKSIHWFPTAGRHILGVQVAEEYDVYEFTANRK